MRRKSPTLVLVPCALAAALAACKEQAAPPPPRPPQVTVAHPEKKQVQIYVDFTGRTRAVAFAEIRARVLGRLDEMLFTPSAFVEEGDVLFHIEPETYQAAFDEATASVASAQSLLAAAASDLVRIEKAIKSNAVSEQDLDRAKATRDSGEAAVLAAQARLDKATVDLAYTKVVTPIPGQVSRNFVDVGNLVGYGTPTLLTTVTKIQPIHVYYDVPESGVLKMLQLQDSGEISRKVRVLVATAGDEEFVHAGVIDYIDNTVDPNTGTIEVRAEMPNERGLLFPGLFVRVRVLGRETEATVIDERALGADLGGKYVLVVGDGNVVEQRYVTLGPVQEGGTVVVEAGLEESESYITEGLLRARPGLPVDPQTSQD